MGASLTVATCAKITITMNNSVSLVLIFIFFLIGYAGWRAYLFIKIIGKVSRTVDLTFTAVTKIEDSIAFEKEFDANKGMLRAVFEKDPVLLSEWQMFEQGLRNTGNVVTARQSAKDCFPPACVLNKEEIANYRATPGVLVGLGLVFTFFGIALVIRKAGQALENAGDVNALAELLSAAGLKFWTSLTGVLLSLVCAQHCRVRLNRVVGTLATVTRRLDILAPVEGHHQLLDVMMSIRNEMGTIAEDTSQRIAREAASVISTSVESSMAMISKGVEQLGREVGNLVSKFTEVRLQLEASRSALVAATGNLASTFDDSGSNLQVCFTEIVNSASLVKASFGSLAADALKAERSTTKLSELVGSISEIAPAFTKFEGLPASLTSATESLGKTALDLKTIWNGYEIKITKLDAQFAQSLATLPSIFEQYSDALAKYTMDLDEHLTASLSQMSDWVKHMQFLRNEENPKETGRTRK